VNITRERIEQLRALAQNQKVDTNLVQEWELVAIYDLALSALSETATFNDGIEAAANMVECEAATPKLTSKEMHDRFRQVAGHIRALKNAAPREAPKEHTGLPNGKPTDTAPEAAAPSAGCVSVPIKPTATMLTHASWALSGFYAKEGGWCGVKAAEEMAHIVWLEMVKAAPKNAESPNHAKDVWMVSSRTFMALFDTQEAARQFVSLQGASVGGGMKVSNHEVFSAVPATTTRIGK